MNAHRSSSKLLLSSVLFVVGCVGGGDSTSQVDGGDITTNESPTPTLITGPAPDLVETTVGDPPASAVLGGSFTASDTVTNQGSASAGASYTKYYLSTTSSPQYLLGNRAVAALAIGASDSGTGTATVPAGVPTGTYKLVACADSGSGASGRISQVDESNESNNCTASAGSVSVSGPDLTETSVSASPSSINALTGTLTVSDTVQNTGNGAAGASVTRWYLSTDNVKDPTDVYIRNCTTGGPIPGRNVGSVNAGSSSSGSASTSPLCVRDANGLHPPASGTYYVIACADETHVVTETNENNNCAASATPIQVSGGIDLVETAVSSPPTSGTIGTSFSITDTVKNNGGDTAPSSYTKFYLSTNGTKLAYWLATRTVASLGSLATDTATTSLSIPTGVASGTYFVVACADSGPGAGGRTSQITETNENNNCTSSTGTITLGAPDLIIQSVSNPPATGARGSTFAMNDVTQNIGNTTAGPSYNKYYLSSNGISPYALLAPGEAVPSLAPGATAAGSSTATIPTAAAPGTYWLLDCADSGPGLSGRTSQINETNESNNCTRSATQIVVN